MHSSKIRTDRRLTVSQHIWGEGICPLHAEPPTYKHSCMQTPPLTGILPKGRPPSLQRQTPCGPADACENITFPDSLHFVDGNKLT